MGSLVRARRINTQYSSQECPLKRFVSLSDVTSRDDPYPSSNTPLTELACLGFVCVAVPPEVAGRGRV